MPGPGAYTMLIRREAFLRVGLFDVTLRLGANLNWYPRAVDRGLKSLMLPDVLQSRRLHLGNFSVTGRDARGDYLRVIRELLERRRRTGASARGN